MKKIVSLFILFSLCMWNTLQASAQTAPVPKHISSYSLSSGKHSVQETTDANSAAFNVAFTETVRVSNAPWLRLMFTDVQLGSKSYIKLTSLKDGAVQHLNAETLAQWQNTSAYFNGDAIQVELFVANGDSGVFVSMSEILVGDYGAPGSQITPLSQCGSTDDRVFSSDLKVGRIIDVGCTGWIISNGKYVTAGHCVTTSSLLNTLEFNVPISLSDGTLQHPGPEDQYAFDAVSDSVNGGVGNDWAVFTVFDNTETGLQPIDAQGESFSVVQDLNPANIRITGFGVDSGNENQSQQTHAGPNKSSSGTTMRYELDTTGGNSGSPVIDDATGLAVGVHTHGGCSTSNTFPGNNSGTSTFNVDFWAALDIGSSGILESSFTSSVSLSTVSFTDASTDSDGTITAWDWDFGDGNTSTSQNPIHTYAADGTYSVSLTVTDNDGNNDTSSQNVVINASNVAPISSFTYVEVDLQVTFSDGSSDSDGNVSEWSWDFGDGNTSALQNPVHNYASEGTYAVSLTVTDDSGSTDTSSQNVTVVAPNIAPTAGFTADITELEVNFTDASSDSDGTVVSWDWDFGDSNTSTAQNPSHTYVSAGSFSVSLTVTDNEGATSTDTQTVTVNEGGETSGGYTETNLSPNANANLEYTIDVPAGATNLDIDTSGGTGDVTLVVNFGSTPTRNDNDCLEQGAGNAHSCNFTNPSEGTWFIIVRGASASSGVQLDAYWTAVDAGNVAPTSDFSVATADLEATFTDASSDNDGSIDSRSWDFGDGNTSTEQNPVHLYGAAGTYTVSLTVTDNEGATDSSDQSVTVSEPGGGTSGGFTEIVSPASGEIIEYTIDVPAGADSLEIDISGGTGNADLAINFASSPTRNDNDCLETGAGNTHNCTITNPSEGTWFIIVRGASASTNVQLDAFWFDN